MSLDDDIYKFVVLNLGEEMDSAIHPQKGEALRDQLCGYQKADLGFHFLFLFIYSIFFFSIFFLFLFGFLVRVR